MAEIVIEGIAELEAALERGAEDLIADLRQGVARACQVATREIRAAAPEASGELRRSIEPHQRNTRGGASAEIQIKAPHASFVRDGTPPHTITAKKARALRWEGGKYGSGPHFAKSVEHPGTSPNDFVSGGVKSGQQTLENAAHAAVRKLKARIEG